LIIDNFLVSHRELNSIFLENEYQPKIGAISRN